MTLHDLETDLAELVAKHDVSGFEFVAACMRVAEGYYPPDDLPILAGVGLVLERLRQH